MFIATGQRGQLARIFKNENEKDIFFENNTGYNLIEIPKEKEKTFKANLKLAKEKNFNNPIEWAYRRAVLGW